MRQERYSEIDTNFMDFAENRKAGFCRQFCMIFDRNLKFLVRNPRTLAAVVFNALFISILILLVFQGTGNFPHD